MDRRRRCDRRDPMLVHGLRRLTLADRLFRERLGLACVTAVLWTAGAWWLLDRYGVTLGAVGLAVLGVVGLVLAVEAVIDVCAPDHFPRWPRRAADPLTPTPPSRSPSPR